MSLSDTSVQQPAAPALSRDGRTEEELHYERARGLVGKYRAMFEQSTAPPQPVAAAPVNKLRRARSLNSETAKAAAATAAAATPQHAPVPSTTQQDKPPRSYRWSQTPVTLVGYGTARVRDSQTLPRPRATTSQAPLAPKVPKPIQPPAKPPQRREGSYAALNQAAKDVAAGVDQSVVKEELKQVTNVFDAIRKSAPIVTEAQIRLVVARFDDNNDNMVNREEFSNMLTELLTNKDHPYELTQAQKDEIFAALDINGDGNIDIDEFRVNWNRWVRPINEPKSAFVIVDVQNDFISGSLALIHCPAKQDAAQVVPVVNKVRAESQFDLIVYTLDSHPENHCSFHSQVFHHELAKDTPISASDAKVFDSVRLAGPPPVEQKLWPDHCVQNSWGEELHKDLVVNKETDKFVHKGTNPEVDSYSAFWDNAKLSQTPLLQLLKDKDIDTVFVCGLAYDVCVGSTALHAIEHGFRTILIEDACAGVTHEGIALMKKALKESGCLIVDSSKVPGLVNGTDREASVALSQIQRIRAAREHQQSMFESIRNGLFKRAA